MLSWVVKMSKKLGCHLWSQNMIAVTNHPPMMVSMERRNFLNSKVLYSGMNNARSQLICSINPTFAENLRCPLDCLVDRRVLISAWDKISSMVSCKP